MESYGTFPLPEAQLDRFFMRIKLGYPTKDEEKAIIKNNIFNPLDNIEPIISKEELDYLFENIYMVTIEEDVMDYLVNIINKTRNKDSIKLGISPRGSIALFKACQVYAAINGRDYILPEDIKEMAPYVLNHRIIARGVNSVEDSIGVINEIGEEIQVSSIVKNRKYLTVPFINIKEIFPKGFNIYEYKYSLFILPCHLTGILAILYSKIFPLER